MRDKNRCEGAVIGCKNRKCKSIYVCCVEKKELEFCYQCEIFPCSKFRKFADRWLKHGQDLILNQELICDFGKEKFLEKMNEVKR